MKSLLFPNQAVGNVTHIAFYVHRKIVNVPLNIVLAVQQSLHESYEYFLPE